MPASSDWSSEEERISRHQAGLAGKLRYGWPPFFFAALCAVFACIGFFVPAKEGPMVGLIVGIVCTLGAVACIIWAIVIMQRLISEVEVYPSGVVWQENGRWREAAWEEIKEFYRIEVKVNGATSKKEVRIKTTSGKQAMFTFALSRWKNLADTMQLETSRRLLAGAQRDYRSGELARFGSCGASQEGLMLNKKLVEWDDIKQVMVGNGMLWIMPRGRKQKDSDFAMLGETPNAMVFLKLLEETPIPPEMGRMR